MNGASAPAVGPQRAVRTLTPAHNDPQLAQHDLFAGILQVLSFQTAVPAAEPAAESRPNEADAVASIDDRDDGRDDPQRDSGSEAASETDAPQSIPDPRLAVAHPQQAPKPTPSTGDEPSPKAGTVEIVQETHDLQGDGENAEPVNAAPTVTATTQSANTESDGQLPGETKGHASALTPPRNRGEESPADDELALEKAANDLEEGTADRALRSENRSERTIKQPAESVAAVQQAEQQATTVTKTTPSTEQPDATADDGEESEVAMPPEVGAEEASVDETPRRRGDRDDRRDFRQQTPADAKGMTEPPPNAQNGGPQRPVVETTAASAEASALEEIELPATSSPAPTPATEVRAPTATASVHAPPTAATNATDAARPTGTENRTPRIDGVARTDAKSPSLSTTGKASDAGGNPSMRSVDRARLVLRVSRAFQRIGETGGVVRLRLHPESLGSVRVEVGVRDRRITAVLLAENEQARNVLAENVSALRNRLSEQGIQIESIRVDIETDEQAFQHHPNSDDSQQRREFAEQTRRGRGHRQSLTSERQQEEPIIERPRHVRPDGALDLQL